MRSKFDEQLALMKNELIQMGALCEEAISLAAKALTEGDKTLAEKVGPLDGDENSLSGRAVCFTDSGNLFYSRIPCICLKKSNSNPIISSMGTISRFLLSRLTA